MLEIRKLTIKNTRKFRKLYKESFPDSERKPYYLMLYLKHKGKMELYELSDNDVFCGLFVTVVCGELVLVDYLAVSPELQGRGIGSETINIARNMYFGKKLFLEIESTLKPCDDLDNRLKRKRFYIKNGLTPCDFVVELFGVEMEVMSFGEKVDFDEYIKLYSEMAGRIIKLKLKRVM